ncbi:hypothetical protein SAMN05518847_109205 [Paenibacillus sp. OV219]|nr:hypothetical protein SAMN05518847_109205 [Paenibacillus sp. OV219]
MLLCYNLVYYEDTGNALVPAHCYQMVKLCHVMYGKVREQ